ncbi:dihydrofolate reductase family protein [Kineococcus gynurae]|uniref:Dihydrofolate reductase family protein n=1 Tax=Kineococcus gynurae TaxID=452979 RepID=A0ABV5LVQ0_9ACTN
MSVDTGDRRELVYHVAVSLDGFIAAPDGDYSAFPVEGDHLAALLAEFTDTIPSHVQSALGLVADRSRFDTVLMGWNTYTPALRAGIVSPYAHLRQIVVGSPGREVGPDVELVQDPVATVRELKAGSGASVYLAGGGHLAGSLLDEIDRVHLKVNPVVLGDGIPLFGRAGYRPRPFDTVGRRDFTSGVSFVELVPRR